MSYFRRVGARGVWIAAAASVGVGVAGPAWARTTRVSVAADGTQANGASGPAAAISQDGRFVVFASAASNLVPNDTNGSVDVFVKDRETGAIVRISVDNNGVEHPGDSGVQGVAMNGTGGVIAFTSRAALLPDDTNTCTEPAETAGTGPSCTDIYIWKTPFHLTGVLSRLPTNGVQTNGPNRQPKLDSLGSVLAFTSDATNLVPDDTNGVSDVFLAYLHAPQFAWRISVSTAGAQGNAASYGPSTVGPSGHRVAFVSLATNLTDVPDVEPCPAPGAQVACSRAFLHDRDDPNNPFTTRLPTPSTPGVIHETSQLPNAQPGGVLDVDMSSDGRFIASSFLRRYDILATAHAIDSTVLVYDRATGRTIAYRLGLAPEGTGAGVVVSPEGRSFATSTGVRHAVSPVLQAPVPASLRDRFNSLTEEFQVVGLFDTHGLSNLGHQVLFSQRTAGVSGDTNNVRDIFVRDRDPDRDGMPSNWESFFGLDPESAADKDLDPDGDGTANEVEYFSNRHPKGTFTRYFAEGANNAFFTTLFSLLNPGATDARVFLRYQGDNQFLNALNAGHAVVVRDLERYVTGVTPIAPENFSTVIESDQPIAADRLMRWGTALGAGSHLETAIAAPAQTWYLAEGATHGAFDLFYLLQNGVHDGATVTIEYLRPAPLPPIVKEYGVGRQSRRTVWVDTEGPGLEATDVSARITSTRPITVERAMYFSRPDAAFAAGHAGAGLTAPATRWFLAEGATGAFFDLYVLIANPGDTQATLDVTYLLPDGQAPVVKSYVVGARSRLTISVEGEDAKLADTAVSVIVQSTNAQPVVVERSMWWPGPNWHETHLSAATTASGTRWAIADGLVGLEAAGRFTDFYVLIANTSPTAGTATVKLILGQGDSGSTDRVVQLPANSRVNVPVAELFGLDTSSAQSFGLVLESSGVEIVVERARYTTADGIVWSEGAAALATRLP